MRSILTSAWISLKTLRFQFLQYFMLVVLFPLTYLAISLAPGGEQDLTGYATALFCSMAISMFVNMQAASIAMSNGVTVMEQYATFKVRPIRVFLGQSLFHACLVLPFACALPVLAVCTGTEVQVLPFAATLAVSLVFLTFVSIVIGSLIPNPNIASPVINMLYMVIVMVTPLYRDLAVLGGTARTLYALNPFAHMVSLFLWSFGRGTLTAPWVSLAVLLTVAAVAAWLSIRRWRHATAAEKLNLF